MSGYLGHSRANLEDSLSKLGKTNLDDVMRFLSGQEFAKTAQDDLTALVGLDVADVLVGQDSLANRGMDAAAMGIGGTLGAVGGPLGIAAGAGLGKMVSDGTQFILGGGKSAEQRKIEEAVKLLQQRGLV